MKVSSVSPHRKKFLTQKRKHFWAKIGQNWPKCAIRIMRILRSRTCRRARGLIFHHFIRIKISWGSAEKITKIRPTVAELSINCRLNSSVSLLLLFDQMKRVIVMWNCCQCVQLSNNQGSQPLTRRKTNCLFPTGIRPVQALAQTPQISSLFQRLYDFSKCEWNKWQKLLISSRIAKWANFSN